METERVDFRAVEEAVTMKMVIDYYGVKGLRQAGDQLRGPCPIHKGKETARSFTAHLDTNTFNCFSCGSKGGVLNFVAQMEDCGLRDAALMLKRTFKVEGHLDPNEPGCVLKRKVKRGIYRNVTGDLFEVVVPSALAEGFKEMVVYRELFGGHLHWIAPMDVFFQTQEYGTPAFTLVIPL
jgi:DNA primase